MSEKQIIPALLEGGGKVRGGSDRLRVKCTLNPLLPWTFLLLIQLLPIVWTSNVHFLKKIIWSLFHPLAIHNIIDAIKG